MKRKADTSYTEKISRRFSGVRDVLLRKICLRKKTDLFDTTGTSFAWPFQRSYTITSRPDIKVVGLYGFLRRSAPQPKSKPSDMIHWVLSLRSEHHRSSGGS